MEERYSSLQEEVHGKTKKLRKVWALMNNAKSEMEDMRLEHQRQMESLFEGVRQLTKDLKMASSIVDEYIPAYYQVFYSFLLSFGGLYLVLATFCRYSSKNMLHGARITANGKSRVLLMRVTTSMFSPQCIIQQNPLM